MSCDYGVWPAEPRRTDEEAGALYAALCEGDTTGVSSSPAIAAFYAELTAKHPEIDDVSEDQLDNTDLCPWSCAFDRSEGHVIMCCVWSKANYVGTHVQGLAFKHGLAFYDPQSDRVSYAASAEVSRKPWWKIW